MTPRYSEAFSRWRSAPLSTPYPPMASESSPESFSERSLDSSSLSARPSHSYSPKDSREEHMEIGTADAEAVADLGIGDGVGAHIEDGIGMGVEIAASDIREDEEEFEAEASAGGTMEIVVDPLVTGGISESTRGDVPDLEGTLYDIVHYMSEVPLDRITEFETAQRQLEAGQLMASGERAGLTDRIRRLGLENLKDHNDAPEGYLRRIGSVVEERRLGYHSPLVCSIMVMIGLRPDGHDYHDMSGMNPEQSREAQLPQRVAEVLANYEVTRASNALEAKSQSQNGNDGNNGNSGNRNEIL
ncbi:hypothetical protein Tco_1135700 [Tanacetum coccineum]